MYSFLLSVLFIISLSISSVVIAQKPDWVNSTPISRDTCFQFFVSSGSGLENAKLSAINDLVLYLGAQVTSETERDLDIIQKDGKLNAERKIREIIKIVGSAYISRWHLIERWEHKRKYHVWYVLEKCKKSIDPTDFTYLEPKARALVPSYGQLYKRKALKGVGILVGAGIVTAGYFVSSSMADDYARKAQLYNTNPIYYGQYKQSQRDWEKGMTGAFIAGGLLYVYNLVDAWATKGPRVYETSAPRRTAYDETRWDLKPYYAISHGGFTLSYKLAAN